VHHLNYIKQLAGQTMVYGMGIIVPRFLNYIILTPFYTRIFQDPAVYGIITEIYAYVIFLQVLLTYGMETGYFRFADKHHNKKDVYTSSLVALLTTSSLFIILMTLFSGPVSGAIGYSSHKEYIIYMSLIIGIDVFTTIPFARLRLENKPLKYSLIRILEIVVNIGANFFFLYYAPRHQENSFVLMIYDPSIGVGYVFISNLISTVFKFFALSAEIFFPGGKFNGILLKKMLVYSGPLLIAGMAGTVNEALDRVLLKYLIPHENNPMAQLGIYGANFKLAVLMTLFIQMFRYAAEPFFFSKKDDINAKRIYAVVMKYFIFTGLVIFLFVIFFMDIFKHFIHRNYWEGLNIVPIVLFANLLMGIFYNQSIWYKLTNQTMYGAYLVIAGAVITILINFIFVPVYGYLAAAWGHLISYSFIVVISFFIGQRKYYVPYELKRILLYVAIALVIYIIAHVMKFSSVYQEYVFKALLLLLYAAVFYLVEKKYSGS
jgi:O-antigen/teichoic acid export membrane protein